MNGSGDAAGTAERGDRYALLRTRFLEIARRRVAVDAAEDLVQQALLVVSQKGAALMEAREIDGLPPLAWCFQVLRNTIGNHYQKERTRSLRMAANPSIEAPDPAPQPMEALESNEATRLIHETLEEMERTRDRCARYLRALAGGTPPRRIAADEKLEEAVLYRRVYRCRQKLRAMLSSRGLDL